jgi:hypothetical protein
MLRLKLFQPAARPTGIDDRDCHSVDTLCRRLTLSRQRGSQWASSPQQTGTSAYRLVPAQLMPYELPTGDSVVAFG